jgi:CRISPR-associated endonuclease/helicase Cas3
VAKPICSFSKQEHRALRVALDFKVSDKVRLYRSFKEASLWWKAPLNWNGEFIKQTEFRKSQPQEIFILCLPEDEELVWSQYDETRYPAKRISKNSSFTKETFILADGNRWWLDKSVEQIYQHFAEKTDKSIEQTSLAFGTISLREPEDQALTWFWHQQLGVYQIKQK